MSTKIRITVDCSSAVYRRIERLQEMAEGATKADIIRRAMAHYEVLLKAKAAGERILLESADGVREMMVVM